MGGCCGKPEDDKPKFPSKQVSAANREPLEIPPRQQEPPTPTYVSSSSSPVSSAPGKVTAEAISLTIDGVQRILPGGSKSGQSGEGVSSQQDPGTGFWGTLWGGTVVEPSGSTPRTGGSKGILSSKTGSKTRKSGERLVSKAMQDAGANEAFKISFDHVQRKR